MSVNTEQATYVRKTRYLWIQAAEQAHASAKRVWYGCANEQNIAQKTREQKKCFKLFDRRFDGLKILTNTTKHDQTAPNKVAKR